LPPGKGRELLRELHAPDTTPGTTEDATDV